MRPIQYVREFWLEYKALKRREIRHALRLHRQLLRAQLAVLVTQTKLARANIEIDLRLRTAADAASKAWRASHIRQIEETQRCMESSVARSAKDGEKEALSKAIGRMAGKIGAMASQPGGLGDIAKSSLGKIEDHKGIVPESIGALEYASILDCLFSRTLNPALTQKFLPQPPSTGISLRLGSLKSRTNTTTPENLSTKK